MATPAPSRPEHPMLATLIASAVAGTSSTLVGFPFDNVKARMQTHQFKSMADCFKHTVRNEGFLGLFRGIGPPLVTISITKIISFNTFESTKNFLQYATPAQDDSLLNPFLAGMTAGTLVSLFSCPFELVKIQMQLHRLVTLTEGLPVKFHNSWQCAKYLYRTHGASAFFTGLHLHITRDAIGTAFYFGNYELLHRLFSPTGKREGAGPLAHFLSGGFAGVASWLVIFPIDLVKSRIQKNVSFVHDKANFPRSLPVLREVVRAGGVRALYSGIFPTLIRAFPAHSINFLVYEGALQQAKSWLHYS